jgi:hypothetical protein
VLKVEVAWVYIVRSYNGHLDETLFPVDLKVSMKDYDLLLSSCETT